MREQPNHLLAYARSLSSRHAQGKGVFTMRKATMKAWEIWLSIGIMAAVGCGQNAAPTRQAADAEAGTADAQPAETEQAAARPADATQPQNNEPENNEYDVKVASAEAKLARPAKNMPAEPPQALPHAGEPLPLDTIPPEQLSMPKVLLSEAHQKLCRVKVGDPFPQVQLADLARKKHGLSELAGKKLTVVVFWNGKKSAAREELADLGSLVEKPFAARGVAVVGINTGDDPQLAAELVQQSGAEFVNLSDADGKAFAKVGSEKLPRTYLLDASGKIVWFDIEYSRTTRQQLTQAIRFLLAQK
jgi:peroxiredoxin